MKIRNLVDIKNLTRGKYQIIFPGMIIFSYPDYSLLITRIFTFLIFFCVSYAERNVQCNKNYKNLFTFYNFLLIFRRYYAVPRRDLASSSAHNTGGKNNYVTKYMLIM